MFSKNVFVANHFREKIQQELKSSDPVNMMLELDQQMFLSSYLHRQDRVGMMYGIEIRTPFLEHRLVGYVNSLPANLKIRNLWHKYILRKVAERHVPKEIVWNRNKTAFSAPISQSLYKGKLRCFFNETLSSNSKVGKYFSIKGINNLMNQHNPSLAEQDHSNTLFRIIALELWLQSFS